MKSNPKVIFLEGIDGTGKSSSAQYVNNHLDKLLGKKSVIVNADNSKIYKNLYNVDNIHNIRSTKLAKFSYRISRFHLALNLLAKDNPDYILFDRGPLNIIVRSKIEKLQNHEILEPFIKDIWITLSHFDYKIIFLKTDPITALERNNKRSNPSENDLCIQYLSQQSKLLEAAYIQNNRKNKDASFDTSHISKHKVHQCVLMETLNE